MMNSTVFGRSTRCAGARSSSLRASTRRARRTARPSAGCRDRAGARARWRRAAACRRKVRRCACGEVREPDEREQLDAARSRSPRRRGRTCRASGRSRCRATSNHGSRVGRWNTMPISSRGARRPAAVDASGRRVGAIRPARQPQQGRLAAARGAQDGEELVPADIEAHAVERGDGRAVGAGEGVADRVQRDHRWRHDGRHASRQEAADRRCCRGRSCRPGWRATRRPRSRSRRAAPARTCPCRPAC